MGIRSADLLSSALAECGLDHQDPLYLRGLGSLAGALALSGETGRARQVTARATELARRMGDESVLLHALTTSMWHGTTPDVAAEQLERTTTARKLARERLDYEQLGAAADFSATVSYLVGRPDGVREAVEDADGPSALPASRITARPTATWPRRGRSCRAISRGPASGPMKRSSRMTPSATS